MILNRERKLLVKKLNSLSVVHIEVYLSRKVKPKNAANSEISREAGNELFKKSPHPRGGHQKIWQKYTMSIAQAPIASEELALAYGNRSALFFHLSLFKECIIDVDRAINITKSDTLKAKLLCRKTKCLHGLGSTDTKATLKEAKSYLDFINKQTGELKKIQALVDKTEKSLNTKFSKQGGKGHSLNLPKLKKEPGDFKDFEVKYNAQGKTQLIATRGIAPGEHIFVEEPFCASILHLRRVHPYCTHCFVSCLTTIPCDNCIWAMYCSEKCKEEASNQYHDIECLVYKDYGRFSSNYYCAELPIRLIVTECRKRGGVANLKSYCEGIGKEREKKIDGQALRENHLEIILSTYNKSPKISKDDVQVALDMVVSLAVQTKFFGKKFDVIKYKNWTKNEDVIFISSLILKLMDIASVAIILSKVTHSLSDHHSADSSTGCFVPTVYNLIRHNCDPNATRFVSIDNKLVLYALKPIKKGDQIFVSYCDSYRIALKPFRCQQLMDSFYDVCKCQACTENWLPMTNVATNLLESFGPQHAFSKPLEMQLYRKNEKLITKSIHHDLTFRVTEHMLSVCEESIAIAVTQLPQPSGITCVLITAYIFGVVNLYANIFVIPDKCNE